MTIRRIDFCQRRALGFGKKFHQEVVEVTTRERLHNGSGGREKRGAVGTGGGRLADEGMYRENLGGNPPRLSRDRLRIQNSQFRGGVCWKKHESNVNLASAPSREHRSFPSPFLRRPCPSLPPSFGLSHSFSISLCLSSALSLFLRYSRDVDQVH